jgi:hypothetical protein
VCLRSTSRRASSLLDKVLAQNDKPTMTTDMASSSAMKRGDIEIVDISSDGEDESGKIKFVHGVRTLCNLYYQN